MSEQKKELTPEELRALLADQYAAEREELLRRSKENMHQQLQFDSGTGELKEVDELQQLIGQQLRTRRKNTTPIITVSER